MQPDHAVDLQAIAIQLLHTKEQETMRLLTLMQNQHQVLLLQFQQQTLIDQQRQIID